MELVLSPDDRRIVSSLLRSTTLAAGLVRRARVILALADGHAYATICATHGVTDKYIAQWKRRVVEEGILALGDRPRSGRPDRSDPRLEAKNLAKTQEPPPAPVTHWTTRRMAAPIGVSHVTVARVWQRAGLKIRYALSAACIAVAFGCKSPDGPASRAADVRSVSALDSARSRAPGAFIRSREAEIAGLPMERARDVSPEEEALIQRLEKHLAGSPRAATIRNWLLDPRVSHINMGRDSVAQNLLNQIEAIRAARADRIFAAQQRERANEIGSPVTIAIVDVFPLADITVNAVVLRRPHQEPRDIVLLRANAVSADVLGSALRSLNAARRRDGDTVTKAQIVPIRDQTAPPSWNGNGQRARENDDRIRLLRATPTVIPGVGRARSMQMLLTRRAAMH